MYLAELHGKLPRKIERMEDILTSNIFSFFKYSSREIFLRGYLNKLGFNISNQEAIEAEFMFWPRFEKNTEPDLVLMVGNYYLLIEAKYFSGFADGTKKTKAQLLREIEGGTLEAKNYGKDFKLIAITADHYYKENIFKIIPSDFIPHFKWTNWQSVSLFLYSILESGIDISQQERDFALDLYDLLRKKNLRDFQGLDSLCYMTAFIGAYRSVFFEASTAKFRGDFIGFMDSLLFDKKIRSLKKTVFLSGPEKIFTPLLQLGKLKFAEAPLFLRRI